MWWGSRIAARPQASAAHPARVRAVHRHTERSGHHGQAVLPARQGRPSDVQVGGGEGGRICLRSCLVGIGRDDLLTNGGPGMAWPGTYPVVHVRDTQHDGNNNKGNLLNYFFHASFHFYPSHYVCTPSLPISLAHPGTPSLLPWGISPGTRTAPAWFDGSVSRISGVRHRAESAQMAEDHRRGVGEGGRVLEGREDGSKTRMRAA